MSLTGAGRRWQPQSQLRVNLRVARHINRLTSRSVATLKEPGLHADGGGLYLRIDKPPKDKPEQVGAKRWILIFHWRGKRTEMGLGSVNTYDLKDARDLALDARKLVGRGINPIEARKLGAADVPTFGAIADELITALEPTWRNKKHKAQWETSLIVHAKALRPMKVDAVTTEDVLDVLKPIWSTIPETASRTRGRIERVLDAAKAKGYRHGENPARWRGHLVLLLPKRQRLTKGHHPALPFPDAPKFYAELRTRPAVAARALEFTILTAARSGETRGLVRDEIDLGAKLWVVPPERMKSGKEHRVPLTPRAVEIIQEMDEAAKALAKVERKKVEKAHLVFPGQRYGRPLSDMAMDMLLRRMGHDEISVHGFRSTFRDWAGESTNFPREIIEAALAHQVGGAVERAYRRGDALEKRRKLMEAWEGYLKRPAGAKVTPMKKRA